MRYIIYGAGAVGGVIGARLLQQGADVVLIARGAHFEAIRDTGLTLQTPLAVDVLRATVVSHPAEIAFRPGDVVIMTTKTQDTEAALDALRAVAGSEIPVVCAQNGVENERIAARRFSQVYAMVVMLPATHLVPGVVQAHAMPVSGVLDAGCYPSGSDSLIERVTADLDASGFSAHAVVDPMRWKYAKLLSNLGNAVQAACGPGGDTAALYARARAEALACFAAAGIKWASDDEVELRRRSMSPLAAIGSERRAGGSTWQSLARGAGSIEVDYLNGEISLLGRLHGVATPVNAALQYVAARMARLGQAPGTTSVSEIVELIGS